MEVTTPTLASRLRAITQKRAVLSRLVGGDLKVKYEGSTLGYVWSVLEPLLLTAVYFFVFQVIGGFGKKAKIDDYPLFLITGILGWQWVTTTVKGSTKALRGNAKLITKVFIPREIFPLAVVVSKTIEFMLSLIVLAVFAVIFMHPPSLFLLAFPLAVFIQLMLLTGIAMFLSAANTLLRDVERIITPLLRVLFYVSPVLYPTELVMRSGIPRILKHLYRVNPVTGIMELYHAVWFPDRFGGWLTVGASFVGSALILVVGWQVFTRLERAVLKEL